MLNHLLFLVFNHNEQQEGLVQMPNETYPDDTNSVLLVERVQLPVGVTNWIFVEASNVFECSPFLSVVSWFLGVQDELAKISVGLFRQSSNSLINARSQLTCRSCQRAR